MKQAPESRDPQPQAGAGRPRGDDRPDHGEGRVIPVPDLPGQPATTFHPHDASTPRSGRLYSC